MIAPSIELPSFRKILKEKVLFNNEPTPELLAILTVYFVQGILGLARLAVTFFFKDSLGLNPAEVATITGITFIPWIAKPVYGFISDGFPIFGYRRRPYIVASGLLGTISWLVLALIVDDVWGAAIALLMTSLSVAISDVIVDSLVVERAREESVAQAGSLQAVCWGASALGGLITAYLSGWLIEVFGINGVFEITATFPLLVSVVAWLIAEEQCDIANVEGRKALVVAQSQQLWDAIKQKSIYLPVAFLFIWQATPTAESAFFFFTTNELGFEPEFLGRVRLVTSVASLVGIFIFQKFLKNIPFRQILGWSIVISTLLGLTTLLLVTHTNRVIGIDDRLFSLGDSLILTVMGQITWLPVLVLCARLCPKGVEATLFALLMSIWNLSLFVSSQISAVLTAWLAVTEVNFENLWLLVTITNLSTLIPLPFLGWLPVGDPQKELNSSAK
ncbi:MAG: folate/biopterin family MFS transporter [Xenococcus sp. MO_188.B8]|nr:folate/biopterin family MFS transporter [Xenococcus sp. MO_188.B8]